MRDFDPTDARFITSGYLANSRPGGQYFDIGGLIGGSGAKKAAKTQAKAEIEAARINAESADKALALQDKQFNKQIELQTPFRQSGLNANNRIAALLGMPNGDGTSNVGAQGYGSLNTPFGAQQFQADPGYQFRFDEGQKAIENGAASRGMLLSGAAQKALAKYGQDFASNEYQNAYNRYNSDQTNQYNRLAGLAGVGQQANNQLTNASQQYANSGSNILTQQGNALANGVTGAANARAAGQQASGNGIGDFINGGLGLLASPTALGNIGGSLSKLGSFFKF